MDDQEAKKWADDAIIFLCRVMSRMCEFATHSISGEDEVTGAATWSFDPIVLQVLDEELPGSIDHNVEFLCDAAAQAYPLYKTAFRRALLAYEALEEFYEEHPVEFWMDESKDRQGAKEDLDGYLTAMFTPVQRLYQINSTL